MSQPRMELMEHLKKNFSVADPFHFYLDPDPFDEIMDPDPVWFRTKTILFSIKNLILRKNYIFWYLCALN